MLFHLYVEYFDKIFEEKLKILFYETKDLIHLKNKLLLTFSYQNRHNALILEKIILQN